MFRSIVTCPTSSMSQFSRFICQHHQAILSTFSVSKASLHSKSYCQKRHLLALEKRLISSSRLIHIRPCLCEKGNTAPKSYDETAERSLSSTEETLDVSPAGSEKSGKIEASKESSQLETIKKMKPPKPIKDDRETSLPNHDVKRITEESRQFERKANSMFQELAETRGATKDSFIFATRKFQKKESLYFRGSVEFIYAGLQEMQHFGVVKDLDSYKALLQSFPVGKMIPRNAWQVEFMHYPRHQQCGIDLLEQMEHNGVIPDEAFGVLLKDRFGREAHVTRKYRRMMYWLPKFRNINPYPIPLELPADLRQLALLALRRMCVDGQTQYNIYETLEIESEPEEDTFIASAQSLTQQRLISEHKTEQPLFVEGPYPVYLRHYRQNYFLLRAEPNINALMKKRQQEKEDANDEKLFEWVNFFDEEKASELRPVLSVHEQDDSTILALAITGSESKSSVVSWIRCLEQDNPNLALTPILFKLFSSSEDDRVVDVIGDNRPFKDLAERTSDK